MGNFQNGASLRFVSCLLMRIRTPEPGLKHYVYEYSPNVHGEWELCTSLLTGKCFVRNITVRNFFFFLIRPRFLNKQKSNYLRSAKGAKNLEKFERFLNKYFHLMDNKNK